MDNTGFIQTVQCQGKTIRYYDIRKLTAEGLGDVDRLPFSIRILVENLLRKLDGKRAADSHRPRLLPPVSEYRSILLVFPDTERFE